MVCENCEKYHNGSYGSGRFCCSKCARSFSTKISRKEINEKVSKKLSGRKINNNGSFTKEQQSKGGKNSTNKRYKQLYDDIDNLSIDDLCKKYSIKNKYILDKIFIDQNSCCGECYITEWNNKPIKFHLHHIDGNNKNNLRYNLIFLCPNCHSQTDNYCFCNRNHSEKTKEKLRDYFSSKI